MSRRWSASPMSFFSFQDVMACVTGIMILVTLIMALDPMEEVPSQTRKPGEADNQRAQLENARKRSAEARQAVADAQAALDEAKQHPQVTAEQLARMEKLLGREEAGLQAIQRMHELAVADAKRQANKITIIQHEIAQAAEQERALQQELTDKTLRNRIRYQSGKQELLLPLLFEVTPTGIVVGELNEQGSPRQLTVLRDAALDKSIQNWQSGVADAATPHGNAKKTVLAPILAQHPASGWYALFVIRQDSVASSNGLRDMLRADGYEVGWQLWNADDGGFFEISPQATEPAAADGAMP